MNLFSLSYYYIVFGREIQMSPFLKEARQVLWYNGHLESQLSTDEIYLSGDVSLPDVSSMYITKSESTKEQIKALKLFGIKQYRKGSCQFVEIK